MYALDVTGASYAACHTWLGCLAPAAAQYWDLPTMPRTTLTPASPISAIHPPTRHQLLASRRSSNHLSHACILTRWSCPRSLTHSSRPHSSCRSLCSFDQTSCLSGPAPFHFPSQLRTFHVCHHPTPGFANRLQAPHRHDRLPQVSRLPLETGHALEEEGENQEDELSLSRCSLRRGRHCHSRKGGKGTASRCTVE